MKMTRKFLMGVVAAATVLALTSCGDLKKDDTEGAIKGSAGNYKIDYTNEGNGLYRAYKPTAMNHSGGTYKITMHPNGGSPDGVMGLIWDLKESADKEDAVDFFIAGVNYNRSHATGKKNELGFYVSKFVNVTDTQADNFGAGTGDTAETAIDVKNAASYDGSKAFYFTKDEFALNDDEDVVVVIDVQPNDEDKNGSDGGYTVKLYKEGALDDSKTKPTLVSDESTLTSSLIAEFEISKDVTGYTNSYSEQNQLAVYANIQAGGTLTGEWKAGKLVNELEVEEE